MAISVIIPTYNESAHIAEVIETVKAQALEGQLQEIIVCDGGSEDGTVPIARQAGARTLVCRHKGRAVQMNKASKRASGDILYFLHADTLPPKGFSTDILKAIRKGYVWGCFRLRFEPPHWVLQIWSLISRLSFPIFRFGDQSLFVKKEYFIKTAGFCEKHMVMEDHEMALRLRKYGRCKVIPKAVVSSSRKFQKNGTVRLFCVFILIYCMYHLKFSQKTLTAFYRKLIQEGKI